MRCSLKSSCNKASEISKFRKRSDMESQYKLDPWFLEHLVCPVDKETLIQKEDKIYCNSNHEYHIFKSIPIMLRSDVEQTHKEFAKRTWDIINRKIKLDLDD